MAPPPLPPPSDRLHRRAETRGRASLCQTSAGNVPGEQLKFLPLRVSPRIATCVDLGLINELL